MTDPDARAIPGPDHAGRIPLTVIGGFLGSGKTTLLNRLLQRADGRRLAVLVNDFGALNIDAALVEARGADLVSLANGCVCCQIGGDLTDALIRVIETRPPPDAIVIEASGVSDPWRIAQVGLADPALALDGVLVLADASAIRTLADDPLLSDTVRRQLDAADLLVLNHLDRVDAATLAALRVWLDATFPHTPRFETQYGDVPAPLLGAPAGPALARGRVAARAERGAGHDDSRHRAQVDRVQSDHARSDHARSDHARSDLVESHHAHRDHSHRDHSPPDHSPPDHSHSDHSLDDHGERFESWSQSGTGTYRAEALRELLRRVPPGVLRLKGLLRTDVHGWAVLQFAGRHGSLRRWPADAAPADTDVSNTFAAVGLRGQLPAAELAAALQRCLRADGAP